MNVLAIVCGISVLITVILVVFLFVLLKKIERIKAMSSSWENLSVSYENKYKEAEDKTKKLSTRIGELVNMCETKTGVRPEIVTNPIDCQFTFAEIVLLCDNIYEADFMVSKGYGKLKETLAVYEKAKGILENQFKYAELTKTTVTKMNERTI